MPVISDHQQPRPACDLARSGHADAGRQVFSDAPAFTASARLLAAHKLHLAHQFDCLVPRCTSPGPAAYAPPPAVRHLLAMQSSNKAFMQNMGFYVSLVLGSTSSSPAAYASASSNKAKHKHEVMLTQPVSPPATALHLSGNCTRPSCMMQA